MSEHIDQSDGPEGEIPWQEDFVRLFGVSQGRVFAYIITMLPNRADAEDVLQQTSLILYRKFTQFDQQRDFVRWACGIAHHVALNHLRKQRRDRHVFGEDLIEKISEERLARGSALEQRHSALLECLQKLTGSDREIIEHYYFGGKTTANDVSVLLHRPVNTILKALIRIRGNLHRCIDRTISREGHA